MTTKNYKKYFEDNATQWVLDAYQDGGYNFPLPAERARVVTQFIGDLGKRTLKILDLGCGGGDVTFLLASMGHTVVGIDQSRPMIELCNERRANASKAIQRRTSFALGSVEQVLLKEKFDVVVAMGLIGYLKNDAALFKTADRMLNTGGYLLVSCRNRLFNMNSLTFRTKNEIKHGDAIKLIDEIEELYQRVPAKDADAFVKKFKEVASQLPAHSTYDKKLMLSPSERLAPKKIAPIEPRQQTPAQLKKEAAQRGFAHVAYVGIRPHLMDPNLNNMLPPRLFNIMSRSLEALEHLPISLAWSSVFIGAFKKTSKKKLRV